VTRRLKIGIATAGRFHVLDLARELHALGHHVRFYSYVPRARARRFGLLDECHVSLLPLVLPAVAWERLMPRRMPKMRERVLYTLLNRGVIMRLHPCDVFICMSGIYLEAARFAKQRYGATIWLHRGSHHILSQDEILAAVPGAERPSDLVIRRELAGYAAADCIVIPSAHVEESFRRDAAAHGKLFLNPPGMNLSMFRDHPNKQELERFSLIYVGVWSLQKGCDLLTKAVAQVADVRLTHVGAIGDCEFPTGHPQFIHVDPVQEPELATFYSKADLSVQASRHEGLSAVLRQALASGLPLVCTDRTGGADLAHTPALAARITVVPHDDVGALAGAITKWRDRRRGGERLPRLLETDREKLGWAAYARRYSDELLARVSPDIDMSHATPGEAGVRRDR
jgi:glycosyltransferase involved in cell wall biosynthesis